MGPLMLITRADFGVPLPKCLPPLQQSLYRVTSVDTESREKRAAQMFKSSGQVDRVSIVPCVE
jgi:hypothetical protein